MTSAVANDLIRSALKIELLDHDPGSTNATITSPDGGTTLRTVDMSIVKALAVAAILTVPAAGGITLLEIIASASEDMSSPEVIKTSGAIAADATGDWAILECDAAEVRQAGETAGKLLRHVAARLTCSNAGCEAVVMHLHLPVHKHKDLTPETTIS